MVRPDVISALQQVVSPAIKRIFRDGEIDELILRWEQFQWGSRPDNRGLLGLMLILRCKNEEFRRYVWTEELGRWAPDELVEEIVLEMGDFLAESNFGKMRAF
jgi:hypothetical protein